MNTQTPYWGAGIFMLLFFLHLHVQAQVPLAQKKGSISGGISFSQLSGPEAAGGWGIPRLRIAYNIADRWALGINQQFEDRYLVQTGSTNPTRNVDISIRRYVISGDKLSFFVEAGLGFRYSPYRDPLTGVPLIPGGIRPLMRLSPGIQAQILPWLSLEGSLDFRAAYNRSSQTIQTSSSGLNLGINFHLNRRRRR